MSSAQVSRTSDEAGTRDRNVVDGENLTSYLTYQLSSHGLVPSSVWAKNGSSPYHMFWSSIKSVLNSMCPSIRNVMTNVKPLVCSNKLIQELNQAASNTPAMELKCAPVTTTSDNAVAPFENISSFSYTADWCVVTFKPTVDEGDTLCLTLSDSSGFSQKLLIACNSKTGKLNSAIHQSVSAGQWVPDAKVLSSANASSSPYSSPQDIPANAAWGVFAMKNGEAVSASNASVVVCADIARSLPVILVTDASLSYRLFVRQPNGQPLLARVEVLPKQVKAVAKGSALTEFFEHQVAQREAKRKAQLAAKAEPASDAGGGGDGAGDSGTAVPAPSQFLRGISSGIISDDPVPTPSEDSPLLVAFDKSGEPRCIRVPSFGVDAPANAFAKDETQRAASGWSISPHAVRLPPPPSALNSEAAVKASMPSVTITWPSLNKNPWASGAAHKEVDARPATVHVHMSTDAVPGGWHQQSIISTTNTNIPPPSNASSPSTVSNIDVRIAYAANLFTLQGSADTTVTVRVRDASGAVLCETSDLHLTIAPHNDSTSATANAMKVEDSSIIPPVFARKQSLDRFTHSLSRSLSLNRPVSMDGHMLSRGLSLGLGDQAAHTANVNHNADSKVVNAAIAAAGGAGLVGNTVSASANGTGTNTDTNAGANTNADADADADADVTPVRPPLTRLKTTGTAKWTSWTWWEQQLASLSPLEGNFFDPMLRFSIVHVLMQYVGAAMRQQKQQSMGTGVVGIDIAQQAEDTLQHAKDSLHTKPEDAPGLPAIDVDRVNDFLAEPSAESIVQLMHLAVERECTARALNGNWDQTDMRGINIVHLVAALGRPSLYKSVTDSSPIRMQLNDMIDTNIKAESDTDKGNDQFGYTALDLMAYRICSILHTAKLDISSSIQRILDALMTGAFVSQQFGSADSDKSHLINVSSDMRAFVARVVSDVTAFAYRERDLFPSHYSVDTMHCVLQNPDQYAPSGSNLSGFAYTSASIGQLPPTKFTVEFLGDNVHSDGAANDDGGFTFAEPTMPTMGRQLSNLFRSFDYDRPATFRMVSGDPSYGMGDSTLGMIKMNRQASFGPSLVAGWPAAESSDSAMLMSSGSGMNIGGTSMSFDKPPVPSLSSAPTLPSAPPILATQRVVPAPPQTNPSADTVPGGSDAAHALTMLALSRGVSNEMADQSFGQPANMNAYASSGSTLLNNTTSLYSGAISHGAKRKPLGQPLGSLAPYAIPVTAVPATTVSTVAQQPPTKRHRIAKSSDSKASSRRRASSGRGASQSIQPCFTCTVCPGNPEVRPSCSKFFVCDRHNGENVTNNSLSTNVMLYRPNGWLGIDTNKSRSTNPITIKRRMQRRDPTPFATYTITDKEKGVLIEFRAREVQWGKPRRGERVQRDAPVVYVFSKDDLTEERRIFLKTNHGFTEMQGPRQRYSLCFNTTMHRYYIDPDTIAISK
jgi:hypothetical protein